VRGIPSTRLENAPTMLIQIVQHTPTWVFALFALLLWLGVKQLSTRTQGLPRALSMGLAMTGLAVYGAVSAFGAHAWALSAWAFAALAAFAWMVRQPLARGTRYDSWQGVFTLPGSWKPLALMMGIFATKYVVGVMLAMQPQLAGQVAFALPVALIYGLFTGVFASRSMRLWLLAQRGNRQGAALSA